MRMTTLRLPVLAAMLVMLAPLALGQGTLTVPDDYATIQAAIDAAIPGDTVYVRAETYTENLVITKPLRLVGEGRLAVRIRAADSEEPVVLLALETGDAMVEGLSLRAGSPGVWVHVAPGASLTMQDAIVAESDFGIFAQGPGTILIDDSLLVDNTYGFYTSAGHAELSAVEISGGTIGIMLDGDGRTDLRDCLIGMPVRGIETLTVGCGWSEGTTSFGGHVSGGENRVFGLLRVLCLSEAGSPRPAGFLDEAWGAVVRSALSYYNRGLRAYEAQNYEGAVEAFERGIARLADVSPFPLLEASLGRHLGGVYWYLGRYEEALCQFESARRVYHDRQLEADVAEIDHNTGVIHTILGLYEDALALFESARAVFQDRGLEVEVAWVDQNIGVVHRHLGRYEEALEALRSARAVFENQELEVQVAMVDQSIGVVYRHLGRYEEALDVLRWARAVFEHHELEDKVAESQHNIGNVYWELGRYEEALAAYESARAVYSERSVEVEDARVAFDIGAVYLDFGWYEEGLEMFKFARAVFEAGGLEVGMALIDNNTGLVYALLGRYEEALAAYEAARAVYEARGMEVKVARVDQNIGAVYGSLGRYEEALAAYGSARAVYEARGLEVRIAVVNKNIGIAYEGLGWYEEALAGYDSALAILDAIPPLPGMRYSHPRERRLIHYNRGTAYERWGRLEEAVSAYEQAIDVVESIRGHLRAEDLKLAWGERTSHVYERLIALLHRMDRGEEAFPYAERSRARTFLDILYGGGVVPEQLISAEAGVSTGVVEPQAIDEAVGEALDYLEPEEAVLSYFVTDRGVYLWVIAWDEATGRHAIGEPVFLAYPREALLGDVIACRQEIEPEVQGTNGDKRMVYGDPADWLGHFYEELVEPGLEILPEGVDTLVFIPSGPLWYLPMAALVRTDRPELTPESDFPSWHPGVEVARPEYLADTYKIAYLPSLASLAALGDDEEEAARGVYVGLANPVLSPEQVEALGMEVYRYEELERAAARFARELVEEDEPYTVYLGDEATEARAHEEAPGHRVVVYAAHGQFSPFAPLQSQLFLASGDTEQANDDRRIPDGYYRAWEVLLTDHRGAELVVLAACESLLPSFFHLKEEVSGAMGVGTEEVELTREQLELITTGDEVVGFARAFLSSGAQRVLGSQWLATAGGVERLLPAIGEHHGRGLTWAEALRQAQLELLSGEEMELFMDPFFWAPFQLIGRWR